MRGSGLVALAAALLAGAPPAAHAAPYAGSYRYASLSPLAVTTSDGAQWSLVVVVTESGRAESHPEQALYVDLARCAGRSCTSVGRWRKPLAPTEVEVVAASATAPVASAGPARARVRTRFAGLELDLRLTQSGDGSGVGPLAGRGSSGAPGAGPGAEVYAHAHGLLRLGHLRCPLGAGRARIGDVVAVDADDDDVRELRTPAPAALPEAFSFPGRSCGVAADSGDGPH